MATGNLDLILRLPNGAELWQGDLVSVVRSGPRFDAVVLCACEIQDDPGLPSHVKIIRAPNDDDRLTTSQITTAKTAARKVSLLLQSRRRVLVTCAAGRNRSGLVSALALVHLTGCPGEIAAREVRIRRIGARALTNESFNAFLNTVPGHHLRAKAYERFVQEQTVRGSKDDATLRLAV